MAKLNEIYKCKICGNIIEVLHTGTGELVCCGQPMKRFREQSKGKYAEKHAPVIEETGKGVLVKIGSVWHPMKPEHYIEWIEIETKQGRCKAFLSPDMKHPKASFLIKRKDIIKARMYCNVHGLWISDS
jgi:superoxide reductase